MTILEKYIEKYAASRRGKFVSQTTTHEVDGNTTYKRIPETKIPVFPVLSFSSLFTFFQNKPKNVLDHGYPDIPVTAARYAIAHALKHMNMAADDEILIPAYHCTVMVAPIVTMGGKPIFYQITANLDTDLVDIRKKITPKTKAIIAVNYCGFIQNMAEVRALCTEKNIILIEDCAHSFFGQKNGVTVGGHGDYILVSARKFFPVDEGGVLLINGSAENIPQQEKQKFIYSLKSFLALIERSLKFGRLWLLAPLVELFNFLRSATKNVGKVPETEPSVHVDPIDTPSDPDVVQEGENAYNHNLRDKEATFINILLPKILNTTTITKRRRNHYLWLSAQFKKMPHCRLMIEELPEGIVPFMLPVYIENLEKYFSAFEDAAIPMQRFAQFLWPDMAENICPITADYSKNVILFPCHQELSQQDLDWLASTVHNILAQE